MASPTPVWSPCGVQRALNLNEVVRLTSLRPYARGIVNAADAEDSAGYGRHILALAWKRCP